VYVLRTHYSPYEDIRKEVVPVIGVSTK
jgi:hypothetical protein